MPTPAIKLMADYGCWPIWHHDGQIGNIDPRALEVTERLAEALQNWAAVYDSHLDVSDPASTTWTVDEEQEFDVEGRRLCHLLAEEVGAKFRVFYSSRCIPVGELSSIPKPANQYLRGTDQAKSCSGEECGER